MLKTLRFFIVFAVSRRRPTAELDFRAEKISQKHPAQQEIRHVPFHPCIRRLVCASGGRMGARWDNKAMLSVAGDFHVATGISVTVCNTHQRSLTTLSHFCKPWSAACSRAPRCASASALESIIHRRFCRDIDVWSHYLLARRITDPLVHCLPAHQLLIAPRLLTRSSTTHRTKITYRHIIGDSPKICLRRRMTYPLPPWA